jgi:hypothetical protein
MGDAGQSRHAHASPALDHGAPIHLVQTTLSHSSVSTTSGYYARPGDSSARFLTVVNTQGTEGHQEGQRSPAGAPGCARQGQVEEQGHHGVKKAQTK